MWLQPGGVGGDSAVEALTYQSPSDVALEEGAPLEAVGAGIDRASLMVALDSPRSSGDVLDILFGAVSEFGEQELPGLPRRPVSDEAGADAAPAFEDFVSAATAVDLAALPDGLRRRLAEVVVGGGDKFAVDRSQPLDMDVLADVSTKPMPLTGRVHQALLHLGASTGLPWLVRRAAAFQSLPPAVLLDGVPPLPGRCFAFRGGASVVLAAHSPVGHPEDAHTLSRLVVEQAPRWQVPNPATAPRHFSVFAVGGAESTGDGSDGGPAMHLGDFEYLLSAPAAQTFTLARPVALPARVRLEFVGGGWGQPYTCVYRVRTFAD